VTTLFGLIVAVPALGAFALFRNRIDEYIAETSLVAEHVFTAYKRGMGALSKRGESADVPRSERRPARPAIPPVAIEREAKS
jgi:hypothetical protein